MKRVHLESPSCIDCCSSGNSVLCSLSMENKTDLANTKGDNFYKKGQVIFYEGNHANGLFCIYDGKVKLSKLGENGKEQIVRFAKTSDILGYRSLLSNDSYQATAVAMEDSHVCILSKERFMNLMASDSALAMNIIQLLAQDLKRAEQWLIDTAQKNVTERISEALLLLYSIFGLKKDEKTINISLTRSEIANIAGTTTETTIRTLAQLGDLGFIKLTGKEIKILNINELTRKARILD